MSRGSLTEYYSGIGFKRLRATEVDPQTSHGHEFQGISAFRTLFGDERQELTANILYLSDNEDDVIVQAGDLSWYDSREKDSNRSAEYRLYYPADVTIVQEYAEPGDLVVIGRRPDDSIDVLIAEAGSTFERQLLWLFAIDESQLSESFDTRELEDTVRLDMAGQFILEKIGVEVDLGDENYLDDMLERFGSGFPDTRTFSKYAREKSTAESSLDGPDAVVLAWIEREEMLFRTFEKHLVSERLSHGFTDDVDGFISFSLSVLNRRKSRAGHAMENHLEHVFQEHNIDYSRGKVTENRSKPDFLFPGVEEYHNPDYPSNQLLMLGVKTSCKDRWRQVLSEAEKIPHKHLFTLEPAISAHQTAEMDQKNLQLVLPSGLHATYISDQQEWLMDLAAFLSLTRELARR